HRPEIREVPLVEAVEWISRGQPLDDGRLEIERDLRMPVALRDQQLLLHAAPVRVEQRRDPRIGGHEVLDVVSDVEPVDVREERMKVAEHDRSMLPPYIGAFAKTRPRVNAGSS